VNKFLPIHVKLDVTEVLVHLVLRSRSKSVTKIKLKDSPKLVEPAAISIIITSSVDYENMMRRN
jgi:hypothetical protein